MEPNNPTQIELKRQVDSSRNIQADATTKLKIKQQIITIAQVIPRSKNNLNSANAPKIEVKK